MPRYLFQTQDLAGREPDADDWLEYPKLEAACEAAEIAVREMAADGQSGPLTIVLTVVDEHRRTVHQAKLEVRAEPCVDPSA
ncbi:hypothetical protein ABIE41_000173 [Bosea sp. OAE506]|uniref:DUF6894 family protein n=1 Tax=Bosea sp. OAE506 TaxID=2663870 RepID=UPI0017895E22